MKTMDRLAQSGAFVRCLASFGSAPIERWLRPGNGHADGDGRGLLCGRGHACASSGQGNGSSPPGGATRAESAERNRPDRGVPRRSDIANYDTRTHAHAHTRTHARTHTHTHTYMRACKIDHYCKNRLVLLAPLFTMFLSFHHVHRIACQSSLCFVSLPLILFRASFGVWDGQPAPIKAFIVSAGKDTIAHHCQGICNCVWACRRCLCYRGACI